MKFWKKKHKENDVIIPAPKANGFRNDLTFPMAVKRLEDATNATRTRNASKLSRQSSKTNSVRSHSDAGRSSEGDSEYESDLDYSGSSLSEDDEAFEVTSTKDLEKKKRRREKKKKKRAPFVNSCCGFCSLGAGSLLTGILYICLGIGFLVYRINDFNANLGKAKKIYTGDNLYKDIWKIILVSGMGVSAISMLGALVLLIASCIFGQKEHYWKMRVAIIIWCCVTAFALLWNIGEGLYVILIPTEYKQATNTEYLVKRFSYKEIKAQLPTIWALTGIHALFYIYLVIVLVSYLRLLKYQGAPKVGGNDLTEDAKNPRSASALNGSIGGRSRPGRESVTPSISSRNASRIDNRHTMKILENPPSSQKSVSAADFQTEGSAYVNWPHFKDNPVSSTSAAKAGDERSLADSSIYDVPKNGSRSDAIGNSAGEIIDQNFKTESNIASQMMDDPILSTGRMERPWKSEESEKTNSLLSVPTSTNQPVKKEEENESIFAESNYSAPTSVPSSAAALNLQQSQQKEKGNQEKNTTRKTANEEETEKKIQPAVVSNFFRKLSQDTAVDNPIEEMFRLFGGDLCSQNPENSDRYLKSYKDVRSKTSHISTLRDRYEFDQMAGAPTFSEDLTPHPPQQFPIDAEERYSTPNSLYTQGSHPFIQPPSRHMSHLSYTPEPVYDRRPRSRGERINHHPSQHFHRQPQINQFSSMPRPVQGYKRFYDGDLHSNYSVYSDQSYDPYYEGSYGSYYGDYVYGDYSDCYSFCNYYPPQNYGRRPTPAYSAYDPLPPSRTASYNSSAAKFSTTSNRRGNNSRTTSTSTWIPINSEDNYSVGPANGDFFHSDKSRSLPNLAEPQMHRTLSIESSDTAFSKPLGPEFTLPSPRESSRLTRSSSWSSSRHFGAGQVDAGRRTSFSRQNRGIADSQSKRHRNYSGYHTGDLRSKTSHTSLQTKQTPWNDQAPTRSRTLPRKSSNRSSRPSLSNHDWSEDHCDDFRRSRTSSFHSSHQRQSNRDQARSSKSFRSPSRQISQVSSHRSSRGYNHNPYPDKHIKPALSMHYRDSEELSHGDSRALVAYNRPSQSSDARSKNSFHRSRSVRLGEQREPMRTTSKQVKFGSTPDLRRI